MNFQKICILIAVILLIILLILIAVTLSGSNSNAVWPPFTANCPDYFVDLNGDGSNCINTFNLGTNVPNNVNFNNFASACDKYNYCNTNLLTWDGITYGYGSNNPCDPSGNS